MWSYTKTNFVENQTYQENESCKTPLQAANKADINNNFFGMVLGLALLTQKSF